MNKARRLRKAAEARIGQETGRGEGLAIIDVDDEVFFHIKPNEIGTTYICQMQGMVTSCACTGRTPSSAFWAAMRVWSFDIARTHSHRLRYKRIMEVLNRLTDEVTP